MQSKAKTYARLGVVFKSSFFIENRKKLRGLVPASSPIVIAANGLLQRSGDMTFSFHQDSNFWYLTGVNEPDAVLVCDDSEEYLIVPQREGVRAAFDGVVDYDDIKRISGIEMVYTPEEGWEKLSARLKTVKLVATAEPAPAYVEFYGMYTNPARAMLITRMKESNENLKTKDIRDELAGLRRIKQAEEILALQQAIAITIAGIEQVSDVRRLEAYTYESELEADLSCYFRKHGAIHAFDPIIAGGHNACTLHYLANDDPLHPGELLMFDVGASYNHYAADIARTIAPNREPSARQLAVHAAVAEVQDFALSLLKPGTLVVEYEKQIEQFMGQKLRELGLIKKPTKESIRKYFPHATSHYLGIDPHDVGGYDEPLAPNAVLTCEPGIYIPEEGIGVRIEDDILITEGGNENLSGRLSRDLV
jgi:Xaa-Pro aminopeptidase